MLQLYYNLLIRYAEESVLYNIRQVDRLMVVTWQVTYRAHM